ncbi:NAD(P)-binding protein [Aspergillus taichungensis]|uniref:NAD(P)-binding protein n=1 Tax=Aspergillus taichungensis TaxID=482145 RepID=A0A2J5HLV3_9EURO|nr:NAD(P)-binding protein [Aspergillus taichungensis]
MEQHVEQPSRGPQSQFETGHNPPVQRMEQPGLQSQMGDPKPTSTQLPTEDSGYQTYKAAGKLTGKRAVITGGDSGIGRAIAILFAMEGASSLLVHLPEEEKDAAETRKRIQDAGQHCYSLAVDLRSKANCQKVVDTAMRCLGGIDILVNNAAYQNMVDDIRDLDDDQWIKTFDTNIHPYFYLSKFALPHMKRGSTIINCASINAYIGRPDLLDYTSTKGAIVSFTRGLSNQQLGNGIRVNCVCPGPVWTPLIPSTMTSSAMEQLHAVPMGRPGQPSEIATCFVFLASADSSYISGQSLHPNGGVVVNG